VSPAREKAQLWREMIGVGPTNKPLRQVGAVAGVSRGRLARYYRRLRLDRPMIVGLDNKLYLSPMLRKVRADIIRGLLREGLSPRQIADETGINLEAVRRTLRQMAEPTPEP
jgi:DNA invertase Pin-like site-specific DNA recombinase